MRWRSHRMAERESAGDFVIWLLIGRGRFAVVFPERRAQRGTERWSGLRPVRYVEAVIFVGSRIGAPAPPSLVRTRKELRHAQSLGDDRAGDFDLASCRCACGGGRTGRSAAGAGSRRVAQRRAVKFQLQREGYAAAFSEPARARCDPLRVRAGASRSASSSGSGIASQRLMIDWMSDQRCCNRSGIRLPACSRLPRPFAERTSISAGRSHFSLGAILRPFAVRGGAAHDRRVGRRHQQ